MSRRTLVALLAVLAAVALGLGLRLAMVGYDSVPSEPAIELGGAFDLVDQTGTPRHDTDFRGRYMLVFFGYTYCPDVCPAKLQTVTAALESLPDDDAVKVVPVFITVDPARDTVPAMADYARHFHPRLVALTGSPEQIAAAARAYRVYFAKAGEDENYLMDHSSFLYLMGPDGKLVRLFGAGATSEEIATALADIL